MECLLIPIQNNLYLASGTEEEVKRNGLCASIPTHFVQVEGSEIVEECEFQLLPFSVVNAFSEAISAALEKHKNKILVVCPERADRVSMNILCLLVGSYLELNRDEEAVEVMSSLEKIAPDLYDQCPETIKHALFAMDKARKLRWLGPEDTQAEFDIEMSIHYGQPCNGSIHTLVPGKLVLFPTPEHLPDSQSWIDICEPGSAVERRFSAAYLADVLTDFDVSVVVCLGECSGGAAAAFEERGLDVHDLKLDPRRPSMLQAMDRLLALARAAPGAVAVFCGGEAGAEWPAHVGALGAAYLMRDLGFEAGAADAWVRMACPALSPPRPLASPDGATQP